MELRQRHLFRRRRIRGGPSGPEITVDGKRLLAFCSNDYLGLSNHPDIRAALCRGAAAFGVGSGAAHLITGHCTAHHALEEELAEFVGFPRALLFSTGYMANLGIITALAGAGQAVLEDRLNHASLLDGALLSRTRLRRYRHGDADSARALMDGVQVSLIVTDGVFSMDGDLAPLPALSGLAGTGGCRLLVDDAHGLGVLGQEGRGTLDHLGVRVTDRVVLMGTLGKAIGTFGAFVAGSEDVIETLIQHARSYIYRTAAPPAIAEATRASLRIARREAWRRDHLSALIKRFRDGARELGLALADSPTPIQPLLAGSAGRALSWSRQLEEQGLLVSAIRPPTVPEGAARLRITLSAAHEAAHVDRLLDALSRLSQEDDA